MFADCFRVLGRAAGRPPVITDEREVTSRRICSAHASGPSEIIRRVRLAEARGSWDFPAKLPDDATVAHCTRLQESPTVSRSSGERR